MSILDDPDGIAELDLRSPFTRFIHKRQPASSPYTIVTHYEDIYLYAGEPDTRGDYPLRIRLFLSPTEGASLAAMLRELADSITAPKEG